MQEAEQILIGQIMGLRIFRGPEFGTRASFWLESSGQCSVACCVAGDVARELLTFYCEGDMVTVRGVHEPRPSTAACNTPWAGRFRVRALRALEAASVATPWRRKLRLVRLPARTLAPEEVAQLTLGQKTQPEANTYHANLMPGRKVSFSGCSQPRRAAEEDELEQTSQ